MKILLVEDDISIANFLIKGLREESYTIDHTTDGKEALYLIEINSYNLIILDIMIPLYSGLEVCRILRDRGVDTPIIMLTAKDTISSKVTGLDYGADDYLTKPFSFLELLARIKVQLRRESSRNNIIVVDDLIVDTTQRRVSRGGESIKLTAKEYALLELLIRNRGRLLSETIINENLTNMNQITVSNVVNVYIYRLRNKIDKRFDKKLIHTIRGIGYMLEVEK